MVLRGACVRILLGLVSLTAAGLVGAGCGGGGGGRQGTPPTGQVWVCVGDSKQNSFYGRSASSAGDVNGDGFAEVIFGAPGFASNAGKVYVHNLRP